MSTAQNTQEPLPLEQEPKCTLTSISSAKPVQTSLDDQSCIDQTIGDVPAENYTFTESDRHDVNLQTRKDIDINTERPHSLENMDQPGDMGEPLGPCDGDDKSQYVPSIKITNKDANYSRNPITGFGLNGDGVGGLKPKTPKNREGNPVTGEGYKAGANDFHQPAPMNGANQVINKNRIPPGGFSSGLW